MGATIAKRPHVPSNSVESVVASSALAEKPTAGPSTKKGGKSVHGILARTNAPEPVASKQLPVMHRGISASVSVVNTETTVADNNLDTGCLVQFATAGTKRVIRASPASIQRAEHILRHAVESLESRIPNELVVRTENERSKSSSTSNAIKEAHTNESTMANPVDEDAGPVNLYGAQVYIKEKMEID